MAYRIRYPFDRYRQSCCAKLIRLQIMISGVIFLGTGLLMIGEHGRGWLAKLLYSEPVSAAELAVCALSDSLAQGDSWYQAWIIWCSTILHAGNV